MVPFRLFLFFFVLPSSPSSFSVLFLVVLLLLLLTISSSSGLLLLLLSTPPLFSFSMIATRGEGVEEDGKDEVASGDEENEKGFSG